jgi:Mobilization protein NikA
MSFCLGKRSRWGPEELGSPNPRTHALCQGNKMKTYKKPDARCHQLNLSLTAVELEDIKRRAEALGMRPVHFARVAMLNAVPSPPQSSAESAASRHIRLQLARLGNNLNQMVRGMHQNRVPLPNDLEPLLKDIRALIGRIPQ